MTHQAFRSRAKLTAGTAVGASRRAQDWLTRGLAVFVFHDVCDAGGEPEISMSPAAFQAQLDWIQASFTIVDPDDVQAGRPLPTRAALLTFDDGFVGVLEHAVPILDELGVGAMLFLNMGVVDREVPMSPEKHARRIRRADLASIASHPRLRLGHHLWRHSYGPDLTCTQFEDSLARNTAAMSGLSGTLPWLAFPYGASTDRLERHAMRMGMQRLFTRTGGVNRDDTSRALRRIDLSSGTATPQAFLGAIAGGRLRGMQRQAREPQQCRHF